MEVKCDLVLLNWNNLYILKECIDSILKWTHIPCRLIIVDNGSTEEGIKEYLLSLKGSAILEIKIILNEKNEGFAGGMNKGMRISNAPYVCLLNNDLVVTDGWLEELIKIAEQDQKIGIVNPSSNNFGLRFGKDTTLEEFAKGFKSRSGSWMEMGACVGFCMLIKREIITKIGYLDESYGYAYFEDTDYSRRAQAAGYKCAMAESCYVYHVEGESGKFLKNKKETFDRSAELFNRKWGKVLRVAYLVTGKDARSARLIAESVGNELGMHNRVWLFTGEGLDLGPAPKHLDLMQRQIPKNFFKLRSFWNIIKKKKKFDRIYVGDPVLRTALAIYRLFRGCDIKDFTKNQKL